MDIHYNDQEMLEKQYQDELLHFNTLIKEIKMNPLSKVHSPKVNFIVFPFLFSEYDNQKKFYSSDDLINSFLEAQASTPSSFSFLSKTWKKIISEINGNSEKDHSFRRVYSIFNCLVFYSFFQKNYKSFSLILKKIFSCLSKSQLQLLIGKFSKFPKLIENLEKICNLILKKEIHNSLNLTTWRILKFMKFILLPVKQSLSLKIFQAKNSFVNYFLNHIDEEKYFYLHDEINLFSFSVCLPTFQKNKIFTSLLELDHDLIHLKNTPIKINSTFNQFQGRSDYHNQYQKNNSPSFFISIDTSTPYSHKMSILYGLEQICQGHLHDNLKIRFVNQNGADNGGLRREFFASGSKVLFSGFFKEIQDNVYWFDKDYVDFSISSNPHFLLGIFLGLAIYYKCLIDIRFPLIFYKKLLNDNPQFSLKDLSVLDNSLAENLEYLLEHQTDDDFEENLEYLTFSLPIDQNYCVDLIKNGSNIPVTKKNFSLYVKKIIDYKINKENEQYFQEIKKGFFSILTNSFTDFISYDEMDELLSGEDKINWLDLRKSLKFALNIDINVEINFWDIYDDWNEEQKKKFLKYLTSSERPPAGGFSNLKIYVSDGPHFLIHTCGNVFNIPSWSKEKLKEGLEMCLANNFGFGEV